MEDRLSGGGYDFPEDVRDDYGYEADLEDEADEAYDDEYVREDFGWFGDEALCGE
jgi:hypothetical protein